VVKHERFRGSDQSSRLFIQGDKQGARDELQSLLNGSHSPEDGAQARELIAHLDDQHKDAEKQ
jgi:hypothetical protein